MADEDDVYLEDATVQISRLADDGQSMLIEVRFLSSNSLDQICQPLHVVLDEEGRVVEAQGQIIDPQGRVVEANGSLPDFRYLGLDTEPTRRDAPDVRPGMQVERVLPEDLVRNARAFGLDATEMVNVLPNLEVAPPDPFFQIPEEVPDEENLELQRQYEILNIPDPADFDIPKPSDLVKNAEASTTTSN